MTNLGGLPEGSVISIRAGGTRRQAPVSSLREHALKFPQYLDNSEPLKIDVLQLVASQRLVVRPKEECYRLKLDSKQGQPINMQMNITWAGAAHIDGLTAVKDVAGGGDAPVKFHETASGAKEYLEAHSLLPYIQGLLHAVIQSKPENPFRFMWEQLGTFLCEPGDKAPGLAEEHAGEATIVATDELRTAAPASSTPARDGAETPDLVSAGGPADGDGSPMNAACVSQQAEELLGSALVAATSKPDEVPTGASTQVTQGAPPLEVAPLSPGDTAAVLGGAPHQPGDPDLEQLPGEVAAGEPSAEPSPEEVPPSPALLAGPLVEEQGVPDATGPGDGEPLQQCVPEAPPTGCEPPAGLEAERAAADASAQVPAAVADAPQGSASDNEPVAESLEVLRVQMADAILAALANGTLGQAFAVQQQAVEEPVAEAAEPVASASDPPGAAGDCDDLNKLKRDLRAALEKALESGELHTWLNAAATTPRPEDLPLAHAVAAAPVQQELLVDPQQDDIGCNLEAQIRALEQALEDAALAEVRDLRGVHQTVGDVLDMALKSRHANGACGAVTAPEPQVSPCLVLPASTPRAVVQKQGNGRHILMKAKISELNLRLKEIKQDHELIHGKVKNIALDMDEVVSTNKAAAQLLEGAGSML